MEELVVAWSFDRSHAGSWHEEARAVKPAAARVPDERAERGHGQHAVEAPVADGLERVAAGLAGTDDALAGGRRRQGPEDVDDVALRLEHRVQAVRAAGEWEREVGQAIGRRERESGLAAGERESGALAAREREFGQSAATYYGRWRRRHGAIEKDRGSCGGAEE
jgi:hypothetical protein